jgi:hypothetical protein
VGVALGLAFSFESAGFGIAAPPRTPAFVRGLLVLVGLLSICLVVILAAGALRQCDVPQPHGSPPRLRLWMLLVVVAAAGVGTWAAVGDLRAHHGAPPAIHLFGLLVFQLMLDNAMWYYERKSRRGRFSKVDADKGGP